MNESVETTISGMEQAYKENGPHAFILGGAGLIGQVRVLQRSDRISATEAEDLLNRGFAPGRGNPAVWKEWWDFIKPATEEENKLRAEVGLTAARYIGVTGETGIPSVKPVLELLAEKYGLQEPAPQADPPPVRAFEAPGSGLSTSAVTISWGTPQTVDTRASGTPPIAAEVPPPPARPKPETPSFPAFLQGESHPFPPIRQAEETVSSEPAAETPQAQRLREINEELIADVREGSDERVKRYENMQNLSEEARQERIRAARERAEQDEATLRRMTSEGVERIERIAEGAQPPDEGQPLPPVPPPPPRRRPSPEAQTPTSDVGSRPQPRDQRNEEIRAAGQQILDDAFESRPAPNPSVAPRGGYLTMPPAKREEQPQRGRGGFRIRNPFRRKPQPEVPPREFYERMHANIPTIPFEELPPEVRAQVTNRPPEQPQTTGRVRVTPETQPLTDEEVKAYLAGEIEAKMKMGRMSEEDATEEVLREYRSKHTS